MTKRKLTGVCCIVSPWLLLMAVMSAYAIASFVLAQVASAAPLEMSDFARGDEVYGDEPEWRDEQWSETGTPDQAAEAREVLGNLVRVFLGFVGVLAIIGIPVGAGVGIYLLTTEPKQQLETPSK